MFVRSGQRSFITVGAPLNSIKKHIKYPALLLFTAVTILLAAGFVQVIVAMLIRIQSLVRVLTTPVTNLNFNILKTFKYDLKTRSAKSITRLQEAFV